MKQTVLLAFGVLVVVAALFINATDTKQPDMFGYEIGDVAQDFKLKNVDGKMIALSDHNGNGAIVIFTCNTCPYAKMYEQRIMELDKKYKSKGFPVIAINPNDSQIKPGDSFDEMKRISNSRDYSFPYLIDETQNVAKAFGATKTPHVYVLSNNNDQYKVEYIGAIDDNPKSSASVSQKYVEDAIEALLAGRKIEKTSANAVGCSIKWRKS